MKTFSNVILVISFLLGLLACGGDQQGIQSEKNTKPAASGSVVNIYSARHYDNDLKLYDQFTDRTGIKVNYIEGNGDALIERLTNEGEASPADIFITADAGILWRADSRSLFQPVTDDVLEAKVPDHLRHPQGHWFGLTKRARVIIYNKEAGLPEGLSRYEDLADPAYKNMLCVRPSSNIYNQSLLASLIANLGPEQAEAWTRGVVANFARPPQGNDTDQITAVAAGICRMAIVNSYYVARFTGAVQGRSKTIGERIGVLFPNQDGRGTHVNISGAGILANAPNRDNAKALLQFLLEKDIQPSFAGGNNEYPVVQGVQTTGPIAELGAFKEDQLEMTALGENQRSAVEIFDRTGWR